MGYYTGRVLPPCGQTGIPAATGVAGNTTIMSEQLCLDWSAEQPAREPAPDTGLWRRRLALRRAALRWLLVKERPTAAAVDVVTRISRLRADIAAFWSEPMRNPHDEGPTQILNPIRTAIIQCHVSRDECWPDCSRSAELAPQLRRFKAELRLVEAAIRQSEPELRDSNTLFEEYAEWRYERTENRDYHRLRKEIERVEQSLYKGTQFERIRAAALADRLYLAVPEGVVQPEELADGWGLLWVSRDLSLVQKAAPEERECLAGNRMHLVQNVAAAATSTVSFALGLRQLLGGGGNMIFVTPPRGHRRPQRVVLPG